MSAIPVDLAPARTSTSLRAGAASAPVRRGRTRHLYAVPSRPLAATESVPSAWRADEDAAVSLPSARPAGALAAPRLRLTARGRLVITTAVFFVVALVLLMRAAPVQIPAGTAPAAASSSVIVHAGDTLSQIAMRELPSVDVAHGVRALQRANGLTSTRINAGDVLVVPAVP